MSRLTNAAAGLVVAVAIGFSATTALAMGAPPTGSAEDKYNDAVQLVEKKDYRGAISLLKEVLDEKPRDANALNYMGYSYRKVGDYNQALSFYKRALDVDPDHKGANEYIGEAYLGLNQPSMAESHLGRLEKICGMGCDEYKELKTAIDTYKKTGKPPQSSANW